MPAKTKTKVLPPSQSIGKKAKPAKPEGKVPENMIASASKLGLKAFEKKNPEFSQYLNLQLGMGTIPPTARSDFLKSEIQYRKFLNRYEIWLKQNKPLPKQAPQAVGIVEVGEVFTRVLYGGREYMRILYHGTGRYEGVETVHRYAKITNPETGEKLETDQIIGTDRDDLSLEYNKEYFEDKIAESIRLLPKKVKPQFYLSLDGIPVTASKEILEKPSDELREYHTSFFSKGTRNVV